MKKMKRSNKNKVLAGVFGGMGEYFDVDPNILRIIGLFLFIWSGFFGFLVVYVIAIFIIPLSGENPRKEEQGSGGSTWWIWLLILFLIAILVFPFLMLFSFRSFMHSVEIPGLPSSGIELNVGEKGAQINVKTEGTRVRQATEKTLTRLPEVQRTEIKDYLKNNIVSANFGGEVFADYYTFGQDPNNVYVWAYISEYHEENGELKQGTAASLPVALRFREGAIVGHEVPGDGSHYSRDIKKMFPAGLENDVLSFQSEYKKVLKDLDDSVKEQAEKSL
jgi:phage shock protein PspC (stress-responsive transcriptional regulator)